MAELIYFRLSYTTLLYNVDGVRVCSEKFDAKDMNLGANDQGADATKNRWMTIPRSLCFILNGDDILLMKRSSNRRVFPNKYNGIGGHIERDEDPFNGAVREIKEETGLDVHDVKLRAIHNIDAGYESGILLFVFTAISDKREFVADETEGTLHWINRDQLMSIDLVEDVPIILERILHMSDDTPPLFAHVSYDTDDAIQVRFNDRLV